METPKNRWDVERAAAWLRWHAWGESGEAGAPALDGSVVAQAELEVGHSVGLPDDDEIDIAGWPALVAPFYD
jgi:hypothetical protein